MELTDILKAIIVLIGAVLSAFVIPVLRQKLSASDLTELQTWIRIGVAAAEQLFTATQGNAKKAYVLGYLEKKGYRVDAAEIDNAVEAAVLQLHAELYGVGKEADQ